MLKDQGNLPEALKAYRDSLAIAERLAKADPGNAEWQVDVAFAYWRLAQLMARSPQKRGKRLSTFCNGWTARAGSRRSIRHGSTRPRRSLRRCESDLRRTDRRPGQAKREPGSQKGRLQFVTIPNKASPFRDGARNAFGAEPEAVRAFLAAALFQRKRARSDHHGKRFAAAPRR